MNTRISRENYFLKCTRFEFERSLVRASPEPMRGVLDQDTLSLRLCKSQTWLKKVDLDLKH